MIEKIDLEKFPLEIRDKLIPDYTGDVAYECIGCEKEFDINRIILFESNLTRFGPVYKELETIDL